MTPTDKPGPAMLAEAELDERLAGILAAHFVVGPTPNAAQRFRADLREAGLVLVPVEPTPEMIAHGWRQFRWAEGKLRPGPGLKEAYRAMLAAAPPTDKGGA